MFTFKKITRKLHPKIKETHTDWYLVIEDEETLEQYMELRRKGVVVEYMEAKRLLAKNNDHFTSQLQSAIHLTFQCKPPTKNIVEDMEIVDDNFIDPYYKIFNDRGIIYITKVNSICPLTKNDIVEIHDEVKCKKCVFPEYTAKDIKVTRWPGGKHYYAKIGGVEVEINGKTKWNTAKMAETEAKKFLRNLKRKTA